MWELLHSECEWITSPRRPGRWQRLCQWLNGIRLRIQSRRRRRRWMLRLRWRWTYITTCPLEGECLARSIVYQATVTSGDKEEPYVGLTATDFKSRYANHKASFKAESKRNSTELSKHIWQLKDNSLDYAITWKILCRTPHYTNVTKRCNLCLAKKYFIICKPKRATLNKRDELISIWRHKDKFLLRYVKWQTRTISKNTI